MGGALRTGAEHVSGRVVGLPDICQANFGGVIESGSRSRYSSRKGFKETGISTWKLVDGRRSSYALATS